MSNTSFAGAAAIVVDSIRTTLSAAWPRSAVSHEVARLVEEGHVAGEPCEMAYSVSVADAASAEQTASAVRGAGYVVDAVEAGRGFITVRASVPLRALDLARSVARLERVVRPHEGFVAVIGPTRAPRHEPTSRETERVRARVAAA